MWTRWGAPVAPVGGGREENGAYLQVCTHYLHTIQYANVCAFRRMENRRFWAGNGKKIINSWLMNTDNLFALDWIFINNKIWKMAHCEKVRWRKVWINIVKVVLSLWTRRWKKGPRRYLQCKICCSCHVNYLGFDKYLNFIVKVWWTQFQEILNIFNFSNQKLQYFAKREQLTLF